MATSVAAIRAPGPRGGLLVGCLPEFRRDPIDFLTQVTETYGDIVRVRFGPIIAHIVNHPDCIAQVLVERSRNYDKRTRSVSKIRATCGASLLTEDGPKWLRHRRLVQPIVDRRAVEQYVPAIVAATSAMLETWREAARDRRPLNVVSELMTLTLVIATRVLFGSDASDVAELIERSLEIVLQDTWRRVESVFDPAGTWPILHRKAFRHALSDIDSVVYRIIARQRRATLDDGNLLAALIKALDSQSPPGFTDRELHDLTLTMLLAGHETTANALAWALALVFRSSLVEQTLAREVDQVLSGRPPDDDALNRLEYTGMVFAEAIRLYPSIWIMERRVVDDDQLGGYSIPAKSMLLISPYVLHRHPRYWHDPQTFDPQRFAPRLESQRPSYAYLPFGAGPHQCIGRFLAPVVGRVIVAMVAQRFRLTPLDPHIPMQVPGITLRHNGPMWMLPVEREGSNPQGGEAYDEPWNEIGHTGERHA